MIGNVLYYIVSFLITLYDFICETINFIFVLIYRNIKKPKFKKGDVVNFSSTIDVGIKSRKGSIEGRKFYYTEKLNEKSVISKRWRYNISIEGGRVFLQVPESNIKLDEDYLKYKNRNDSIDKLLK